MRGLAINKIAVIGTGYVGLVTGSVLADLGLDVTCVDNNSEKINGLREGIVPIYEPGLDLIVERNICAKRLVFTTDIKKAVSECDVIMIAVGTPPAADGSADLQFIEAAVREMASHLNNYKVIVNKSTVPIGTAQKIKGWIFEELRLRGVSYDFDILANPEFLREGSAINDFLHPDRVVIGSETTRAVDIIKQVYRVLFLDDSQYVVTDLESAEMIKYASNAFLAMKVTFMNEIAHLCEKVGANVQDVANGMGMDRRIGSEFLLPGPGFGGSCFPKDTRAIAEVGRQMGAPVSLIEQTIQANENQKLLMARKISDEMGDLQGKQLAVLGLSFKPNTDDMREAPSITILNELAKKGANFKVYDPIACKEANRRLEHLRDRIVYCSDEYETMKDSDALIIITEWKQFRNLNLEKVKILLKKPIFFDLRNLYQKSYMEEKGFKYVGVGQGTKFQPFLVETS
ncbi:UDP-glucose/GDP-mannose dehydrogenase family protein [Paenibacillus sp. BSR1-1]|uniref:UDP-glucose dehydrogenase family protein n=1 Tax=Paenibacillus sp. BSR1-1 TaxID=3020845 RepID=UPI0025AF85FD|nr:UDP-glucose/GDP-mannose dehydrogenase family protein [Paenibacillus sp. BSR1-1]MDN3017923.1 UDP-glucose/GDP-mannose dehydrogenase family protein [Paenibacillus sp. BSR1-1]